ncbi:transporter [Mediterraneibacter agrestimuris]|uniref:transporter n=1 Tax=Mediterraneibacter agrestimuris TaxID=2941333 RepID=UPI00203AE967|nr:transporter [Mediterraneibacter agrestimuris]
MKTYQLHPGFGIVCLFLIMLICPKAVFTGASEGLLLWFQIILPTLFPFLLVTNLLLATGSIRYISSAFGGILSRIFKVSQNGSFAVLTGFLCGYPMGAKTAADLTVSGYISREEGQYLLSFCNNTSPVFILNFLVWKTLQDERLMLPTLCILMLSPVIVSFFTRKKYLKHKHSFSASSGASACQMSVSRQSFHFREIDSSIMNSFETLIKVGGYIMLFSVILTLFQSLPFNLPGLSYVLPFLEVTNGIVMLAVSPLPVTLSYPLILGLTAFGGLCSVAQTQCMVQKAGLPILPYIKEKLAAALTASILGTLYLLFF